MMNKQNEDIKDLEIILKLRRDLTKLARGIRVSTIPDDADLSAPQSARDDEVLFGDRMVKRRRIVLLTPRCLAATCLMCPLPNEALDDKRRPITPEQIVAQFENSMTDAMEADFELLTIYTNGNFFADNEVPPISREHIYRLFGKTKAKYLLVESLPQLITEEKLLEAKRLIGDKKIAVAIGLQSSSDLVRAISVNTTCTREAFEKTYALLHKYGYILQAFLMIKPPFLTEEEAITDTVNSIGYLANLGIVNPILCACRVAPNTVLDLLDKKRGFRPPWLWSIVEILKRANENNPGCFPRVVISELQVDANPDSRVPHNCEKCSNRIVGAITKYNDDRDIEKLSNETCTCYPIYAGEKQMEQEMEGKKPLEERVSEFLLECQAL